MQLRRPRAWGDPQVSAVIRAQPEDFVVLEELGFEPDGSGEHVFLHLEKRALNTLDMVDRVAHLSGAMARDIGYSGLKDRNALTRQWLSVGMAGKTEPNWVDLEGDGDIKVLASARHLRKLKRGVHRANRFELRLTNLHGDRADLETRLRTVASAGVPNYFGEQRFGRNGQTLQQAYQWVSSGRRKMSRRKRSLYLSALRSFLFNELLAARVSSGRWNYIGDGDVCMLQGSRSRFSCEYCDEDIMARCERGDIHPGLALWGSGRQESGADCLAQQSDILAPHAHICEFLVAQGLNLAYRSARLMADDFCWQFCDDGSLRLQFALGPGGYATAVLAELVQVNEGIGRSGNGSE